MLTVLPVTDAGTRHLTEVDDSKVMLEEIELRFANTMRHSEINRSKIGDDVETVTTTGPNREYGGFKTILGMGKAGGEGAVVEGGAAVVAGGGG